MLTVSGGFVVKCDGCGSEIEYDAEILDTGMRIEKRPLGDYIEHDFHADLKCHCGRKQSIHFIAAEYPDGIMLEESERCKADGCVCIRPPDMDDGRVF